MEPNFNIIPPVTIAHAIFDRRVLAGAESLGSVSDLARAAGWSCKMSTTVWPAVYLLDDDENYVDIDHVARRKSYYVSSTQLGPFDGPAERAARILEVLAYGFFDVAAKETCRKKFRA